MPIGFAPRVHGLSNEDGLFTWRKNLTGRAKGGTESAGEERDWNVRFQAYSAKGWSGSALEARAQALGRAEAKAWAAG